MTRPGGSDLSPLERAARVFTPKVREIEINRERTEGKRECVHRGRVAGRGDGGWLFVGGWVGGWRGSLDGWRRASCKLAGLAD